MSILKTLVELSAVGDIGAHYYVVSLNQLVIECGICLVRLFYTFNISNGRIKFRQQFTVLFNEVDQLISFTQLSILKNVCSSGIFKSPN